MPHDIFDYLVIVVCFITFLAFVTSCGVREQDLYRGVCYVEGTKCK